MRLGIYSVGEFEGVSFASEFPERDDVDVVALPLLQVAQQALDVGLGDAVEHIGVVLHVVLGGRAFVQDGEFAGVRDGHSGAEA